MPPGCSEFTLGCRRRHVQSFPALLGVGEQSGNARGGDRRPRKRNEPCDIVRWIGQSATGGLVSMRRPNLSCLQQVDRVDRADSRCPEMDQVALQGVGSERGISQHGNLDQCLAIAWAFGYGCSERSRQRLRRELYGDHWPVKNAPERETALHLQVFGRLQERVDRRRDSAAATMTKHHQKLQVGTEMFDSVAQAAEHVAAQLVAGDTDHEQVIRALVEDQFDRDSGIRTAEDTRKGSLRGARRIARQQAEIVSIDRDHATGEAIVGGHSLKQSGERAITRLQASSRCIGVCRSRFRRNLTRLVAIGDLNRPQTLLPKNKGIVHQSADPGLT